MTVLLMTRRNVGLIALSYLVAKGYDCKVISDDKDVLWLAENLGQKIVDEDDAGEWGYLISCHWHKIIDEKYLKEGKCVNIHPCLTELNYKGVNPVKRYIHNKNKEATIDAHFMTNVPDEGEVIATIKFKTGKVATYASFYNQAFKHYFYLLEKIMEVLNK